MNRADARPDGRAWIWLVLVAAGLRIAVLAALGPYTWFAGGDGPWYVRQAWHLSHAALDGPLRTVGPLYPLVLAAVWLLFPSHPDPVQPLAVAANYLTIVRLIQIGISTLSVGLTYGLARRLDLDRRGALLAAAGVALGPAFVIEPFLIHSETLFIALYAATVLLYVRARRSPSALGFAIAGVVCALGALTRPVLLLFPGVLAAHLALSHGRSGVRWAGALVLGTALTLAPWHIWLHRGTGNWLPEGFSFNLLSGAQSDGRQLDFEGFVAIERHVHESGGSYLGEAFHVIAADPVRWVARRSRDVAVAILQPHGTSDLGGPSVKAWAVQWLRSDRSLSSLWQVASTGTFWVRLLVYLFHYAALVLAVVGVWATRRQWRIWLPVYGAVAYLILVYGVLNAIPRYLFPAEVFLWVLAGAGAAAIRRRRAY